MKKIGIMSMQRIRNYGSFLQAYGLKKSIEKLGYEDIVKYIKDMLVYKACNKLELYSEDEIQKIEVYKKIAAIESLEEYKDIKEELEDRYSNVPDAVYNLMDIAYIKSLAKELMIEEIKETPKEVRFKFPQGYESFNKIYHVLLKNYRDDVLLYFGETPFFAIKLASIKKEESLNLYKEILKLLIENSHKN